MQKYRKKGYNYGQNYRKKYKTVEETNTQG